MEAQANYSIGYQQGNIAPIVETSVGWMVDLTSPDPDAICAADIAKALSRINRFNGHTSEPWSVASHSMLCVDFARQFFASDASDWMCLHILLHDAHEAYTGDIISPIKNIPELKHPIKNIEERLQHAIETRFDIGHPSQSERAFIKMIDEYVLAIEAHHLMHSKGRDWNLRPVFKDALDLFDFPVSAEFVYRHFIYRFEKLLSNLEFDRRTGVAVV